MDLLAVHAKASELIERARRGEGPAYLVCNTYRFHGHHAGDPLNYREKEEVERWRQQDPIERVKSAIVERGVMRQDEVAALEQRVSAEIDEAVEFAKSSPEPSPDQLMTDIYA
jgi:pyruvate dehydrogenase E1 component alpha subunit